ncbi:hypothetical protein MBLNU459_g0404t3 [Dothideomycetes sp. NU459]
MPYSDSKIREWVERARRATSESSPSAIDSLQPLSSERLGKRKRSRAADEVNDDQQRRPASLSSRYSKLVGFKRAKIGPSGPAHDQRDRSSVSPPQPPLMDPNATPRPATRTFSEGRGEVVELSDGMQSSTSSVSIPSASSSKRSRKSGGVRPSERTLLRTIPRSVNICPFAESAIPAHAPLHFKDLVDRIIDFSMGWKTVPESFKAQLQESGRVFRHSHDLYYGPTDVRAQLGLPPTLQDVDRVVERAGKLSKSAATESAWKSFVHGQLLDLAEYHSQHRQSVSAHNMTRLVDYAIALNTDGKLSTALERLPLSSDGGVRSLNHTRDASLVDKPLVVSIETKSEGGNLHEAQVQLGVWAAAHLTRLDELLRHRNSSVVANPPWLPLLIAQGPQWYFLFARRTTEGKTDLFSKLEFGDATSTHGVFKILSVLQLLFDWAEREYRPWFEENAC